MQPKSEHFKAKYIRCKYCQSFLFTYLETSKAEYQNQLSREIRKKKCDILNIPSSFRLEKKINLQGPCLVIIYSFFFNIQLLVYYSRFQINGFKDRNVYYTPNLIQECSLYQNSIGLCLNFTHVLSYKVDNTDT